MAKREMSGKRPVSKWRNQSAPQAVLDTTAAAKSELPSPLTVSADDDFVRKLADRLGVPTERIEIVRSGKSGVEVAAVKPEPRTALAHKRRQSTKRPRRPVISDEEIIEICKKVLLSFVQVIEDDTDTSSDSFTARLRRLGLRHTKYDLESELFPQFFEVLDLWEDRESARKLYVLLTIIFRLSRRIGVLDPDRSAKRAMKDVDMCLTRAKGAEDSRQRRAKMQPFVEEANGRFSDLPIKRRRREVKRDLLDDHNYKFREAFSKKDFKDRIMRSDIDAIMEEFARAAAQREENDTSDCRVIDLGDGAFAFRREPGEW
jgi:hypothetical protein